MKFLSLLTIILWLTPALLQILIALVMVRRKLVRVFPIFFGYSIYVPARDVILLVVQNSRNLYSYIYWVGEAISILLGLLALYEVLWHLVSPYRFLRSVGRTVFKIVGLVAFGIATAILVMMAEFKPTVELLLLLDRSAGLVRLALLVTVLYFVTRFGLTWRHYATGILAGFGIAGLQVIAVELFGGLHLISNVTFMLLPPAIYNCAVIVWAWYFVMPGRKLISEPLPETDLAKWNEAIKDYLSK